MIGLLAMMLAAQPAPGTTTIEPRDHVVDVRHVWRAYPGGWTPKVTDALRAKTSLVDWLASPKRSSPSYDRFAGKPFDPYRRDADIVAAGFAGYTLQYVGVRYRSDPDGYRYEANGRRAILIHGFRAASIPTSPGRDVDLDQEQIIFDGGPDLFDALVDAEDGRMIWFQAHGRA